MNTLSFISQFIPVILGIIFFKNISANYKQSRIVFYYCLVSLIIEIACRLLLSVSVNNMLLFNFYTLFEFAILILIFTRGINYSGFKKYLIFLFFLYPTIWITLKIFIEDFNSFDNYSSALSSMLLTSISLFMLFKLMAKNETGALKNPTFWFLSSVFVYHFLNIIVFLFYNLKEYEMMWTFHSAVNIISQILMTIYFISLNRLITDENKNIRDLIRESDEIRNRFGFRLALAR